MCMVMVSVTCNAILEWLCYLVFVYITSLSAFWIRQGAAHVVLMQVPIKFIACSRLVPMLFCMGIYYEVHFTAILQGFPGTAALFVIKKKKVGIAMFLFEIGAFLIITFHWAFIPPLTFRDCCNTAFSTRSLCVRAHVFVVVRVCE